jgi:hypothetical protein
VWQFAAGVAIGSKAFSFEPAKIEGVARRTRNQEPSARFLD